MQASVTVPMAAAANEVWNIVADVRNTGKFSPEVIEAVRELPLRSVILDGEAIALRPDGRPRPFQETASRAASRGNIDVLREAIELARRRMVDADQQQQQQQQQ